jgi:hypothetical protein
VVAIEKRNVNTVSALRFAQCVHRLVDVPDETAKI